jgi:hypothetical protein
MTRETEAIDARVRLLLGHARENNMRLSGDQRIGERDAAQLLGVHADTLRRWRDEGNGPAYFRIGGAISYALEDLAAYIVAGRHSASGTRMY